MKIFKMAVVTAALVVSTSANSALIGRDLDGNLTTAEAYYDDITNLTWLADANYAQTSGYDADGRMTWYEANNWASTLEINGVTGWRLPTMVDTGVPGCNTYSYSGTDCGYNVDTTFSEMGNLFYTVLGNSAMYDAYQTINSSYGLTNTGNFINFKSNHYWSDLAYLSGSLDRWTFEFGSGRQGPNYFGNSNYALAVQTGDIGASIVPVPAATWLFGSGLIGLFGFAKRKKA